VHGDQIQSTALLTNLHGRAVQRLVNGPWGEELAGNFGKTPFTYAGTQRARAPGLQYMLNRWYDPQAGRFVSRDPIGLQGGQLNLYGYVANNPILRTDRQGLQFETLIAFSVAGALAGALGAGLSAHFQGLEPSDVALCAATGASGGLLLGATIGVAWTFLSSSAFGAYLAIEQPLLFKILTGVSVETAVTFGASRTFVGAAVNMAANRMVPIPAGVLPMRLPGATWGLVGKVFEVNIPLIESAARGGQRLAPHLRELAAAIELAARSAGAAAIRIVGTAVLEDSPFYKNFETLKLLAARLGYSATLQPGNVIELVKNL
jgi:RHS repeat-associated protein